ncbi:MAG: gliding motility-associated C-terminal domain-containing protein, partial [Flavobacteriales bacterium]|nr:gliding motility-associated C-terminal domain-containing protein [Flavobacteriales bacterium]
TAQFDANPNPVDILNPIVNFTDMSSSDVVGFEWLFLEGASLLSTSSQQNPSYEFPEDDPGSYNVELLVVNGDGCEDTVSLQVIVNGVFTCYVPTAFTPDGDGLNDFFYVKGESIDVTNFTFMVFNRWGEKVFETEDINDMWDGRHKNSPAQEDIYIWKVETKDVVTGKLKEFTGHVNLMR